MERFRAVALIVLALMAEVVIMVTGLVLFSIGALVVATGGSPAPSADSFNLGVAVAGFLVIAVSSALAALVAVLLLRFARSLSGVAVAATAMAGPLATALASVLMFGGAAGEVVLYVGATVVGCAPVAVFAARRRR
ncbi:hypothetical protein CLV72_109118 [Allonocardiopsis opalescens]|uniref:Uncharacterized protein n=2 Tax=Allonocardiopsis opalescens TaxID=1144618 RepID=A0A2T0PVF2_9ACTN|nr:hypothetical protein CLV72_109118 [Allonocardiopsis opalescens]